MRAALTSSNKVRIFTEIDYIYYSSSLRGNNYNIPLLDKIKIKIIAGKIMPALITSTASISGLLALQL